MSIVLLLGAGLGAGVLAVIRGVRPARVPLRLALSRLERGVPVEPGAHGSLADRLSAVMPPAPADLEIVERSAEQHARRRLGAAAALAVVPVLAVLAAAAGGVDVTPATAVVPAVVLGAIGLAVPDVELRGRARERREQFVHGLSGYLDVTAVLLAGGAGTETALRAAAKGDEWHLRVLREALDRSQLVGHPPWSAFGELGERLGVLELTQLAVSLELGGAHGARIRRTLGDRAVALRTAQRTAVETRAREATEQMSVPVALLAVAFMLFVGFPAVWIVLGQL